MVIGQKGLSTSRRSAEFPSGVSFLERELAEGLSRPDVGSNFDAMCEVVSESGLVSKKCRECNGLGAKPLGLKRAAKWDQRIASAESPSKRAELRAERFEETICRACGGSGSIVVERSRQATPCDDCDGVPGRHCRRCLGRGMVFLGPIDYRAVTTRCGRCKGCGEIMNEDLEDVCQLCRGNGFTIPCTAFETGSSKKGRLPPGYEGGSHHATDAGTAGSLICHADEEEIAEHGAISRLLEGVRQRDARSALVLETYHGAIGDSWKGHHWGRAFSVWWITDAGTDIVRRARARPLSEDVLFRGAAHLARPDRVLAAVRAEQGKAKVPDLVLRSLLTKADEQHRELLQRARRILAEVAAA